MQSDYYIGLMSGSSLDGADLCLAQFKTESDYEIIATNTYPYSNALLDRLRSATELNSTETEKLHHDLGHCFAEFIQVFLKPYCNFPLRGICMHGHTTVHQPDKGISVQLGCAQTVANKTNFLVISNLRQADIDAGGQGAPIVPIADSKLFKDYKYCLNLGGIANISIKEFNTIKAWDICSCNQVLNHFAQQLNLDYDNGGQIAKAGRIHPTIVAKLNQLPYYQQKGPKSLANSFALEAIQLLNQLPAKDALATATEHIAQQIAACIQDDQTLVCGGGAYNKHLIASIQVKTKSELIIPDAELIEFKEAMVMAYFGFLNVHQQINCLASVTGAQQDVIGGERFYPN